MNIIQAMATIGSKIPINDEGVKKRLDRAYDIVTAGGYEVTMEEPGLWRVSKASTSLLDDTSAVYAVTDKICSCPDFDTARAGLCKHRLAVKLLTLMESE